MATIFIQNNLPGFQNKLLNKHYLLYGSFGKTIFKYWMKESSWNIKFGFLNKKIDGLMNKTFQNIYTFMHLFSSSVSYIIALKEFQFILLKGTSFGRIVGLN